MRLGCRYPRNEKQPPSRVLRFTESKKMWDLEVLYERSQCITTKLAVVDAAQLKRKVWPGCDRARARFRSCKAPKTL